MRAEAPPDERRLRNDAALEYIFLRPVHMVDEPFEPSVPTQATIDLRDDVARVLLDRKDVIINDSVAVFPFSAPQPLDADYCSRLGEILIQLLSAAAREGRLDSRAGTVIDLHRLVAERALPVERLFHFVYLTERSALDELSLDERIGSTSEAWALAAQLIRHASFDLLAAFADRLQQQPTEAAIKDRLTTLYTRAMMDAVLGTVLQRAERGGWAIALIILDIDRLSEINMTYGYGVGDRVLERMGIQMRKYFRQEDWVFRHADDSIAVLMAETTGADAMGLAQRVLAMVEERLGFRDHLTETRVQVTVSAAVVAVQMISGEPVDPERLLLEAEGALERAKRAGRGSIERVDIMPSALTVDVAARYLDCSSATVEQLLADGSIRAAGVDPSLVDRQSLESYRHGRQVPGPAA